MSGHSKWSTIKHKKEATDAARGKLFSKLSRAILIAVKTGGGEDPAVNNKLRMAIEAAKSANMPKVNIEKAVSRGGTGEKLSEVSYEGFGPGNISVIVEAATDNRNRTAQEIKGLFEHGGGRLGGPGSVSYNFETKGLMVVEKGSDIDDQMLKLIDLGVEEVEETDDGIEIYTEPSKLSETRDKVDKLGFMVTSYELTQKPKTLQTVSDKSKASKLVTFLEKLESHDDVQKVFANLDVPDDVLGNIS